MLGIVLGYNVFTSDQWGSSTASFVIPWDIVAVIVVATVVAAELMAWIPARLGGTDRPG